MDSHNAGFSFGGRVRSVRCAAHGIGEMIRSQHNAWIHSAATIAVIGIGLIVGLNASEWCCITLAIITVWTAEALNTAFEFLTDVASPEFHPLAGKAKDVAAGAVLISAIGAVIVGTFIFIPRLVIAWQHIFAVK